MDVQNARIQAAYKKFQCSCLYFHQETELDVDLFKKISSEYAAAKELAIKEASQVVDVENIKHIVENERLIGDVVEKSAEEWKSQKEILYRQTGFCPVAEDEKNSFKDKIQRKEKKPVMIAWKWRKILRLSVKN